MITTHSRRSFAPGRRAGGLGLLAASAQASGSRAGRAGAAQGRERPSQAAERHGSAGEPGRGQSAREGIRRHPEEESSCASKRSARTSSTTATTGHVQAVAKHGGPRPSPPQDGGGRDPISPASVQAYLKTAIAADPDARAEVEAQPREARGGTRLAEPPGEERRSGATCSTRRSRASTKKAAWSFSTSAKRNKARIGMIFNIMRGDQRLRKRWWPRPARTSAASSSNDSRTKTTRCASTTPPL